MSASTVYTSNKKSVLSILAKYKFYYLLILPGLLYFLIWKYIPMFGIIIAFKDIAPFEGINGMIEGEWVGLEHFTRFFNSYYFWNVMGNTLAISLWKLFMGFPAPIILALLLNEVRNMKFKKVIQNISYLPHFLSLVIISGLVMNVLSTNGGIVNEVIKLFGKEPIFFLGSVKHFRGVLIVTHVWRTVGWGSILYLAALSNIDPSLYEAAVIDGANKWNQTLYITLPGIANIAVIILILDVGHILSAGFEEILLLYSPVVYEVADIIDTYVYREGIIGMNYSYAAAVDLFKSIVGLVLILGTNFVAKKFGKEGIW